MIYFTFSRIGSLILSPFGLLYALLISQLFLNKKIISLSSILIIWISSMPITSKLLWKNIEYPWVRLEIENIEKANAIVVLSGGGVFTLENNIDLIEWKDPDRFISGINLYKKNKAPIIIFSNGISHLKKNYFLEGDIYENEAKKLGLPSESILKTGKATNTANEARLIRTNFSKLFENDNKIILVTSAYHMQRAKRIFDQNNFNVIPFPVDFKSDYSVKVSYKNLFNYMPNPNAFSDVNKVFREILGRILYRIIHK